MEYGADELTDPAVEYQLPLLGFRQYVIIRYIALPEDCEEIKAAIEQCLNAPSEFLPTQQDTQEVTPEAEQGATQEATHPAACFENVQANRFCPFHTVPIELVAHVFSYLDIFDLSQCSTVCRRWEVIVNDSPLVRKSIIVDIQKWGQTGADKPAGETLLKHFVVQSTRYVILRWPLGSCPPEAELLLKYRSAGLQHYVFFYDPDDHGCTYDYEGPVSSNLKRIANMVKKLWSRCGNATLTLTLQNLNLYIDHIVGIHVQFLVVHYDNVQIYRHFEPCNKDVCAIPVVLRIELSKKTVRSDDISPAYGHFNGSPDELFDCFITSPLSSEEERCMDAVLRSHAKIGYQYTEYWKRYFGREVHDSQNLSSMDLNMNQIREYPMWQQYLARDLLQYYPLDNNEITSVASTVRSRVHRALGPFKWESLSADWNNNIISRHCENVSQPLW
ncbi:uncharacterized protein LOC129591508 [Paramacrobiotus metropolitanus]|uniref:uncharacterized protein LOC129591508 n=1 Tax=Paramacrobiotus metropolitanus TaxID=2943436 RepID=UPI002445F429|nr:uncharacterized protein LOC129591508 [Paramacrobiotus metropolitanus]XP_055343155.1 uncharacterized protein LOC129591508 [Paramacrobiotus metropolitanus]